MFNYSEIFISIINSNIIVDNMKIGITGSTCSGKTTFLNYLGFNMNNLRKDIGLVTERAMECPYPLNDKGGFRTQWYIQSQQILKEYEFQQKNKIIITDRTVFDGISYLQIAPHNNQELDFIVNVANDWNKKYPYNYIIYFAPIIGLELSDGAEQFQKKIDKSLRAVICNRAINPIIYIPYQEKIKRCREVFDIIDKIVNNIW
jgi:hypothetical protein